MIRIAENLIENSADVLSYIDLWGATGDRAVVNNPLSPTGKTLKVTNIVRTNDNYVLLLNLKTISSAFGLNVNEQFVFSFYLRTNTNQTLGISTLKSQIEPVSADENGITSSMRRIDRLIRPTGHRDSVNNYNCNIKLTGEGLTELEISPIMLNRGTESSDIWTPAHADLTPEQMTVLPPYGEYKEIKSF